MHRNKKSEARNSRRQRDCAEHALSEAIEAVSVYDNFVDLHGEALKGLDSKRRKTLMNGREIVNKMKTAEEMATRLAGA